MKWSPYFRIVIAGVVVLTTTLLTVGTAAADEMNPDCTGELQQIPRDGTTTDVSNLWFSYSGSFNYAGLSEVTIDDVELDGAGGVDGMIHTGETHVEFETGEFSPGSYQWTVGDGPRANLTVREGAEPDSTAPEMGDGDLEVDLELLSYDEFPVIFRQWTLSFPAATDDRTDAENLRYVIEFTSQPDEEDGEEETHKFTVAPDLDNLTDDRVTVVLGGPTEDCNHAEPGLPVTEESTVQVSALDLAKNRSSNSVSGIFEGVSEEKLHRAHDEMNDVIGTLDDEESETTEEVVEELEEEPQEDETSSLLGCSSTAGQGPIEAGIVLMVVGLVAIRRT